MDGDRHCNIIHFQFSPFLKQEDKDFSKNRTVFVWQMNLCISRKKIAIGTS